jgi:hypothetical protein
MRTRDVLTAFEATLKPIYLHKIASQSADRTDTKPVGNAFQNIERHNLGVADAAFAEHAGDARLGAK